MDLSRSTFKLFLTQSGRAILLFAGITLFARQLDPDQLGTFFLFQAMLGLLSLPADLGVRGALEKRLSEGADPDETLASALVLKLGTLSMVSLGLLVARPYVNSYLGEDLVFLLIVALVIDEFARFFVQTLRGEMRVEETAIIQFSRRFVWIGTGGVLVSAGYGVRGIVLGLILGAVVGLVWAFRRCNTAIGTPSLARIRSLFDFSKYHMVSAVGGRIYQWLDILIIGFFLAQRYVSAYEVAWQTTLLVLLLSNSIALSIFPQVSRWDTEAATEKIETTISTAIGFALFISVPALVGGAIFAGDILRFVFGSEYVIAAPVLIVLLVEKLFQSYNDIIESSVRAIDRPNLAARATLVAVGLNLLLNPILVLSIGFVGAAIATTASWFVNTLLHTAYLSRFVSVDVPYRLVSWYAVSALVMGGVLLAVRSALPVTSVPLLLLEIAIGGAVYLGLSLAIPDVRNQIVVPGIRVIVYPR